MIIKRATKDGEAFFLDVEISTPALIEELEKRRPCDICEAWMVDARPCKKCLWQVSRDFGGKVDNFKPAK